MKISRNGRVRVDGGIGGKKRRVVVMQARRDNYWHKPVSLKCASCWKVRAIFDWNLSASLETGIYYQAACNCGIRHELRAVVLPFLSKEQRCCHFSSRSRSLPWRQCQYLKLKTFLSRKRCQNTLPWPAWMFDQLLPQHTHRQRQGKGGLLTLGGVGGGEN